MNGRCFGIEDIYMEIAKKLVRVWRKNERNDRANMASPGRHNSSQITHDSDRNMSDSSESSNDEEDKVCKQVFTQVLKTKTNVKATSYCTLLTFDKENLDVMRTHFKFQLSFLMTFAFDLLEKSLWMKHEKMVEQRYTRKFQMSKKISQQLSEQDNNYS